MRRLSTAGAGFIGSHLADRLLGEGHRVTVIDDLSTGSIGNIQHLKGHARFRYYIDTILNRPLLAELIDDCDGIFHLAAVVGVKLIVESPVRTIETNVKGMTNMIKVIIKNKPSKFINISTDKAADPSTLYGSTKNLAEHLTSWGKAHISDTKFASVRFGNVFETRGNVFEVWEEQIKQKKSITITDYKMKRYYFQKENAVKFILKCIPIIDQGNIFIPKMKNYSMKDLALKYSKNHEIIGLREGEKLSEILLSEEEKKDAVSMKDMWIIKKKSINLWPQKKKK